VKILWHSNSPAVGTGYGQQTALFVPLLAALGHEIAISAFFGQQGAPGEWHGFTVYPSGRHPYGSDVLPQHAKHFGADIVITLMDVWALDAEPLQGLPLAHWLPVDTDDGDGLQARGLSLRDHVALKATSGIPIAMSRHGARMLVKSGHNALYVPHGVDASVFRPQRQRPEAFGDRFVIGMNAANASKADRKAWTVQLAAFAKLHRRHPDALLYAHTIANDDRGINLKGIARDLGISGAVAWTDEYAMTAGTLTPAQLAAATAAWDLYSGCSKAEGFGIPVMEAQACGVPSVVTDGSAMSEVGCGWKVQGEPEWSRLHAAWWRTPRIADVAKVYERAYERGPAYHAKATKAREHALAYDAARVTADHWKPALEALEERLCG
jgi:glycosyltransferase involved in cell wall biosynthesis